MAAIFARRRLTKLQALDRAKLARDAYTYLHLRMVAGIVLFALGLKTTLRHVGDELDLVPAVALALVIGICAIVVAYEAIARREYRVRLRHPDREGVG